MAAALTGHTKETHTEDVFISLPIGEKYIILLTQYSLVLDC